MKPIYECSPNSLEYDKRKEIADTIGCNENEVVMFEHRGVVNHSVYGRV